MQTQLHSDVLGRDDGREADAILRSCVHCGFCNATCPTYLLRGDERDGPRGRIYLIKQLLEKGEATEKTQRHLDRCLTCRSCETTCPSDVKYGRLLDISRSYMDSTVARSRSQTVIRAAIRTVLPYARRFAALLTLARLFRFLLPRTLRKKIPDRVRSSPRPMRIHGRKMLSLSGCAQSVATPQTNASVARVLDRLGITVEELPTAGCCGAIDYHLSKQEAGKRFMRNNIDAWWPSIQAGTEAIVSSASGCGAMLQDYGEILATDPDYAHKARVVSSMSCDISEVLLTEDLSGLIVPEVDGRTAYHCPCTLQHALALPDAVQAVLAKVGINVTEPMDSHLCCGSAGTYSLLQPELSGKLLSDKLGRLMQENPSRIVTANVGCQLHLLSEATVPVCHWIELLDR